MAKCPASRATILIAILAIAAVQGCYEQSSPNPAKEVAAAPLVPFSNIATFDNKAPNDLVADLTIGKVIRSIVPQAQLKCMDEIFNYMPDLQLSKDGSVSAQSMGSHADNWMIGYVNASPTGEVDIVLQCDPQADNKPPYLYFTTRNIAGNAPVSVLNWYYIVAREEDVVRVSDGKETRDIPYAQFLKETLAGAASSKDSPNPSSVPTQPEAADAVDSVQLAGSSWLCSSDRNNDSDRVTFDSAGGFEFVVNLGSRTESHRLGTYRQNARNIDVTILRIPELSELGGSPYVSIRETIAVNERKKNHLRFTQWENSDPSDKIIFSCSPLDGGILSVQGALPKAESTQQQTQGKYEADSVKSSDTAKINKSLNKSNSNFQFKGIGLHLTLQQIMAGYPDKDVDKWMCKSTEPDSNDVTRCEMYRHGGIKSSVGTLAGNPVYLHRISFFKEKAFEIEIYLADYAPNGKEALFSGIIEKFGPPAEKKKVDFRLTSHKSSVSVINVATFKDADEVLILSDFETARISEMLNHAKGPQIIIESQSAKILYQESVKAAHDQRERLQKEEAIARKNRDRRDF